MRRLAATATADACTVTLPPLRAVLLRLLDPLLLVLQLLRRCCRWATVVRWWAAGSMPPPNARYWAAGSPLHPPRLPTQHGAAESRV